MVLACQGKGRIVQRTVYSSQFPVNWTKSDETTHYSAKTDHLRIAHAAAAEICSDNHNIVSELKTEQPKSITTESPRDS